MNSVENELFEIATDQGEQNMKTLMQKFKPLQDSIDSARYALRNNDTTNALQHLNSTDVELLKITQQLPAEGEKEDEEDTEDNKALFFHLFSLCWRQEPAATNNNFPCYNYFAKELTNIVVEE